MAFRYELNKSKYKPIASAKRPSPGNVKIPKMKFADGEWGNWMRRKPAALSKNTSREANASNPIPNTTHNEKNAI